MGKKQLSKRRIWRPLRGHGKIESTSKYNSSSSNLNLSEYQLNSSPLPSMVHCRCYIPGGNHLADEEQQLDEQAVSPVDSMATDEQNFSALINHDELDSPLGSSLIANCCTICSLGPSPQLINQLYPYHDSINHSSPVSTTNHNKLGDANCEGCRHQTLASPSQLSFVQMSPCYSNNPPDTPNASDTKPRYKRCCSDCLNLSSITTCLDATRPSVGGQATSHSTVRYNRQVDCCSPAIIDAGSLGATFSQPNQAAHLSPTAGAESSRGLQTGGSKQQVSTADEHNCSATGSHQLGGEESKLQASNEKENKNTTSSIHNNLGWTDITMRYRTMQQETLQMQQGSVRTKRQVWFKLRHSCFFQLLMSSIHFVFPILSTFKGYNFPDDLLTDITSGITVAVLHVPQGMAYGTLAGVDPIYGLYVSLIPVLIMSLMSSSRHVSYGTFAIVSIMLANAVDSFKTNYRLQLAAANQTGELAAVVLVNNHQPPLAEPLASVHQESLLTNFFMQNHNQQDNNRLPMYSSVSAPAAEGNQFDGVSSRSISDYEMPDNIEILSTICLIVGLFQVLMATLRFGVLSLVLSEQVVSGFTTASALHVITSQLSPLFDLSLTPVEEGPFKICRIWIKFVEGMCAGFNRYTGTISIISMIALLLCKQLLEPRLKRYSKYYSFIPSELILMFILIFCSWRWKFQAKYGVRIIGSIPTELPTVNPPRLDIAPLVLQDAITIAIFTFAMNFSLGQVYAKRFKYKIKSNQELFAVGTTNCISSFFSCFPCGSSLSRTAILANLNVKSPLCSLMSCACILSIICYLAPLLYNLPYCALSCIVVIALFGVLAQAKDLGTYWRQSKLDAFVWVVTFVSVIAFNVTLGLVIGVLTSLLVILVRLFTPDYSILGRLSGTDLFVDIGAFSDCNEIEQVKIIRFNSALCYLNQTIFKSCVEKLLPHRAGSRSFNFLCSNQAELERERIERAMNIKFLIIDCSAFSYCDYSGVETLIDIMQEFDERGVRVLLASCPLKLLYMIERMKHPKLLLKNIYPTLSGAVNRAASTLNVINI